MKAKRWEKKLWSREWKLYNKLGNWKLRRFRQIDGKKEEIWRIRQWGKSTEIIIYLVFALGHQAGTIVEYYGASHEGAYLLLKIQTIVPRSFQLLICSIPKLHSKSLLKTQSGASLVAQWLRICLPMQGTRVRALVWEDPTCRRAIGPMSHNYWACASGACAPQQERPR